MTARCLFLSTILSSIFLSLACSRGDRDEPPDDQESDGEWRVVADPPQSPHGFVVNDRPRARGGSPAIVGLLGRASRLARDALLARPDLFGPVAGEGTLELAAVTPDPLGGARVRFIVRVQGLRVDGGDAVVVLGPDGAARAVSGWFPAGATLDGWPAIDRAAAEATALEHAAVRWPDDTIAVEEAAELVALPQGERLGPCWRVLVGGEGGDGLFRRELFVDAVNGAVVHEREGLRAYAVPGSGVGVNGKRRDLTVDVDTAGKFRLEDRARNIRTGSAAGRMSAVGTTLASDDARHWDEGVPGAGAAVDAHANAAIVHDYLEEVLGRDGWDGHGSRASLVVHYGEELGNAFWDGKRAIFGDGDGQESLPFPGALDVVAHELFHGVVGAEAELIYEREPGALSESLSDVFGSLVEGRNWIIGEAIGDPIRDLEAPWTLDQPAHMSELVTLPATPAGDMGGVHVNSTIPSHAAFLVAEGGTHPVSHVKVMGIGLDAMRAIWWRAVTTYLAPRSTFRDFAEATRTAAEDLYGPRSTQAATVTTAWRAVGVIR